MSIFEVIISSGQTLTFRRQLHDILLIDYNIISYIINNYTFSLEPDCLIWRWHSSGRFTTHSDYEWLSFKRIADIYSTLW
jgi:hypothetical protein